MVVAAPAAGSGAGAVRAAGTGGGGGAGEAASRYFTIHSIIHTITRLAAGAHIPQCEARPALALYPMPAGARECFTPPRARMVPCGP